ncbi:MAG: ribosome silencing factor [bacterium]|nr:ribosome silencing factor [bacterium]
MEPTAHPLTESPHQPSSTPNYARSLEMALAAARVCAENRGREIKVLDMRGLTALFDYFVIATGSSRRQLHAMSEEIDHKLEGDLGDKRENIAGYDKSHWIVLDYGNIVIHLFDDETRAYYSLENLWADAKPVDLGDIVSEDE